MLLFFMFVVQEIPSIDRWFLSWCNIFYRSQVVAFWNNQLAITKSTAYLSHDLAWYCNSGVNQVWGIGVPLWEFLFSIITIYYPDYLIILITIGIMCYLALTSSYQLFKIEINKNKAYGIMLLFGVLSIILLQPGFIGLMRSRLAIYEKVIVYEYIFSIILMAVLIKVVVNKSFITILILCALAGYGALIRPTLLFYGATTLLIALLLLLAQIYNNQKDFLANDKNILKNTLIKSFLCISIFLLGCGILYITNLLRFGDGFEFGHRLNLQDLTSSMYSTHFDCPYQQEPIISAGKELCGLLFLTKKMNGSDFLRENFFPGQSSTIRWREVYLTHYDLTYIPILLGGVIVSLLSIIKIIKYYRNKTGNATEPYKLDWITASLGIWGLIPAVLLSGFYLRCPVITSRYLMDYLGSFCALSICCWIGLYKIFINKKILSRYLFIIYFVCLVLWLRYEISNLSCAYGPPSTTSLEELEKSVELRYWYVERDKSKPLPSQYDANTLFESYDIRLYNGTGWQRGSGIVKPLIILFMDDPEYLELTVNSLVQGGENIKPVNIRAKIGLELLEQESIRKKDEGWVVRFHGPKLKRYQKRLQVSFIVFVPNTRLKDETTPWRLLKVRWKDSNHT